MTDANSLQKKPLVCPARARLTEQWRTAKERETDEVARTERTLSCASLNEYGSFLAVREELRRAADQAAIALRSHRHSHGC